MAHFHRKTDELPLYVDNNALLHLAAGNSFFDCQYWFALFTIITMPKSSSTKRTGSAPSRPSPGLGRGLSEIISQSASSPATGKGLQLNVPATTGTTVRPIPLSQIVTNPRQPRLRFAEEPLEELVASIREHGILQPITVRPRENQFEIIAGERRYRACQKAGLATIPAIVKVVSDIEAYELALIENLQREDLDPVEEARGYRRLVDDFSLTQEQIAQKVGRNRATVANAMRLLDLPNEIHGYLSQNRLTPGHARAILGLVDKDHQIRVARGVIKQGLNVRQTEQLVARFRSGASMPNGRISRSITSGKTPPHLHAIRDALQQKLATRIQIQPSGNGGRIEIHYYNPLDLDRLLELLQIRL